jgi:uncharacterized protein (DUF1015 family)
MGSSLGFEADAKLARVALVKPFRALRYDEGAAGPLDTLVAPPYDVIASAELERYVGANPYNVVRLIRPHEPALAARRYRSWLAEGALVREDRPAVWRLEEEFVGPDGVRRTRRGLVARVRLDPGSEGAILPHERTFSAPTEARLELLRAVDAKLSPIFLLHAGPPPLAPDREPDVTASLSGVVSRLWRVEDPDRVAAEVAAVRGPLVIADGHHRYEAALRYHEEKGTEETAFVLAVMVSCEDEGLTIFPTHRVVSGALPDLNGGFRLTELEGGAGEALVRLGELRRDHPAFVLLRPGSAVLAELPAADEPLERLDVSAVDRLALRDVTFTPSAAEAEEAVASGRASGAFLVRAPTVAEVQAIARLGKTMPQKSTYFYPKLTSGLLFSPFDE